jgi:hypothetical protein
MKKQYDQHLKDQVENEDLNAKIDFEEKTESKEDERQRIEKEKRYVCHSYYFFFFSFLSLCLCCRIYGSDVQSRIDVIKSKMIDKLNKDDPKTKESIELLTKMRPDLTREELFQCVSFLVFFFDVFF